MIYSNIKDAITSTTLSEVFNRLNQYGIKIRADNAAHQSTEYLGFIIDKNGSAQLININQKLMFLNRIQKQLNDFRIGHYSINISHHYN